MSSYTLPITYELAKVSDQGIWDYQSSSLDSAYEIWDHLPTQGELETILRNWLDVSRIHKGHWGIVASIRDLEIIKASVDLSRGV